MHIPLKQKNPNRIFDQQPVGWETQRPAPATLAFHLPSQVQPQISIDLTGSYLFIELPDYGGNSIIAF